MLIHEIAKKCGITKKAVQYYVEQGIVSPKILENGYKDFSEKDVEALKKVVLYRQLNLSVSEIKCVLKNAESLKGILYQRTLELEKEKIRQDFLEKIASGEEIESLAGEIENLNENTIIIKRLVDMFPGYFGKYISLNFARYLLEKIETEEQRQAFKEIVVFFDNAPDLEIPDDLKQYLDEYLEYYSGQQGLDMIHQMLDAKEQAMDDIEKFVQENKNVLDEYYRFKQTEEYLKSPGYRLMTLMKEFCGTNGYYDVFIPAMRRLSHQYNEYYEQLLRANEEFVKNHPEYLE